MKGKSSALVFSVLAALAAGGAPAGPTQPATAGSYIQLAANDKLSPMNNKLKQNAAGNALIGEDGMKAKGLVGEDGKQAKPGATLPNGGAAPGMMGKPGMAGKPAMGSRTRAK